MANIKCVLFSVALCSAEAWVVLQQSQLLPDVSKAKMHRRVNTGLSSIMIEPRNLPLTERYANEREFGNQDFVLNRIVQISLIEHDVIELLLLALIGKSFLRSLSPLSYTMVHGNPLALHNTLNPVTQGTATMDPGMENVNYLEYFDGWRQNIGQPQNHGIWSQNREPFRWGTNGETNGFQSWPFDTFAVNLNSENRYQSPRQDFNSPSFDFNWNGVHVPNMEGLNNQNQHLLNQWNTGWQQSWQNQQRDAWWVGTTARPDNHKNVEDNDGSSK